MSDDLQNNDAAEVQSETQESEVKAELTLEQQLAERDSRIEDLQAQFNAVKSKSDELLTEVKTAKQKAREAAEAREQARLEKAKKEGDFEQLLKSAEQERNTLKEQLDSLKSSISQEKVRSQSMQLASELADGANAELLSEFISRRINYDANEGMQVLDSNGNATDKTLAELKAEFESNEKFKALIRGPKSTGGGAPGSSASGASKSDKVKVIDRQTFDSMNHYDRASFFKNGGKIVDSL
jgi:glutaredoxin 2